MPHANRDHKRKTGFIGSRKSRVTQSQKASRALKISQARTAPVKRAIKSNARAITRNFKTIEQLKKRMYGALQIQRSIGSKSSC